MNTTGLHIPSNKIRDIERYCHSELDNLYGSDEVKMFVRMLFEAFLGMGHVQLLTSKEETVNQSDLLRFHWAVEDLRKYRPIQYIIGFTDFCGCRIEVNENTLIPRPETEEIVMRTMEMLSQRPPKRVLDLCTGSGCIAIALARHWPEAEATAVDISTEAFTVAERNAQSNNVRIKFLLADILSSFNTEAPAFDLIVSNPPYVMESERSMMRDNVLNWEPPQALFVSDKNPLLFYRAIADIAEAKMAPSGLLVLEINEQLGQETLRLFEERGFRGELHHDYRGKERMLTIEWDNQ